jgi:hypothetical protein
VTDDDVHDDQLLLGFDARPAPSRMRDKWPLTQKREALLRLSVVAPLSVDYLIWPSAWPHEAPTVGWRGPIQGLWDDVARLESHLGSAPGRLWIVAVALELKSVAAADQVEWRGLTSEVHVATDWRSWKALGYDVADRFLTSSTLWFRPGEDVNALRSKWGPQLNGHHLFANFDSALKFRDCSNLRAPEHAPHFVYRLFFWRSAGQIGEDG